MDLVIVTHPDPIDLEARPLRSGQEANGAVALGYYHDGHLVARGIVLPGALEAINGLLAQPVSVALAATVDEDGNIDARVCLVLPLDPDTLPPAGEEEPPEESWRGSLPELPAGIEARTGADGPDRPRLALLPIGNVVRGHKERRHPVDVAADAQEMLDNLVGGRAQDAVQKAIDDLLREV